MSQPEPRPTQATIAGALIIGGSIVVILGAYERIATLQTLEVQRSLETWLDDARLGMGVETFSRIIRVLCIVGAAAAAAAAVLGAQVFKRSLSARTALTVLSPFLLVGGTATQTFLAPMVVLGIVLLWLQPTRDWYAGKPWVAAEKARREARLARSAPPAPPARPDPFAPPAPPVPPTPTGSSAPGAAAGPAAPGAPSYPTPWTAPPGYGKPGYGQPPAVRGPRPQSLVTACVVSWIASGVAALGFVVAGIGVLTSGDEVFAELQRQQPELARDIDQSTFAAVAAVVFAGFVLWCLGALVLAFLTWQGRDWARITLVVSAATAAVVCLVGAISAPPVLIVMVALLATVRLLLRPEVAAWCRAVPARR